MFDEEPNGDPHGECAAKITMLRTALRQVAQAHAWLAFGECRSFGADVALLSPSDADAVARVALGEYREGPNPKLTGAKRPVRNEMTNEVESVVMCNVREHNEKMDVSLEMAYGTDRLVVKARNEGGHNCTEVDLLDLLKWVSENKPDIYMQFVTSAMMRDYT